MLIPTGFWSYTTSDDRSSRGKLSQLRSLLASELQQQVGRSPKVNIFQDVVAIPPGSEWDRQIRAAIEESSFIIPIVTPGFLQSEWCCREVALFKEREEALGVKSLVFPLHYVDTEHLDGTNPDLCDDPEVLAFLRTRQWTDFRALRLKNPEQEDVAALLEALAKGILRALREADVERQRAEDRRHHDEAEARRLADDRRHAAEAEAARVAEQKRRQEDAGRLAEEARQRKEAEAARIAEDKRLKEAARAAAFAEKRQMREEARQTGERVKLLFSPIKTRKILVSLGVVGGLLVIVEIVRVSFDRLHEPAPTVIATRSDTGTPSTMMSQEKPWGAVYWAYDDWKPTPNAGGALSTGASSEAEADANAEQECKQRNPGKTCKNVINFQTCVAISVGIAQSKNLLLNTYRGTTLEGAKAASLDACSEDRSNGKLNCKLLAAACATQPTGSVAFSE